MSALHARSMAILALAAYACAAQKPAAKEAQPAAAQETAAAAPSSSSAAAASGAHGLDLAGIDRSIAPGDDFFAYANGSWAKNTPIPPDQSSTGSGEEMAELTARRTAELIRELAQKPDRSGDAKKIGDYFATFMDEAAIEAKGLAPLRAELTAIAAIEDARGLSAAIGATLRDDVDVLNATNLFTTNLFGLWIAQDLSDPGRYSVFMLQGGLGMPDRDYYLNEAPRNAELRKQYQTHLGNMMVLAGVARPEAEAKAARIFALEQKIALVHAPRVDSEDVEKGNNHWTRAELESRAPGPDWRALLGAAGLEKQPGFVVWQPAAIAGTAALVKSEPLSVWKETLAIRALERAAAFLPKAFVAEQFAFFGKALQGTPEQRERWKRGVAATNAALGEAVGKLYVERYFPPAEKARAEEMVKNELVAFGKRIDALEWMAPQTKARAKAKLGALKVGVGYPDKWRDYSGFEVIPGDALGNAERATLFDYQQKRARLGQPVDRGEWVMNPQLVDAVNLPAMNALNFPAAILQPPAFDPERPVVMDYGCAGAIIGHEISHSFDDQGALFDERGRLQNWWTQEDFAHFRASSQRLIEQYSAYRPFPDLAVNGKQTVSENIADVAGLAAAYDAYRISLAGKEGPQVQGLSGDQQFFLSFAQCWRDKAREESLRLRIVVDGHAPPEYRADTVRNLDGWYPAFEVRPGQKLYLAPGDRVRVW